MEITLKNKSKTEKSNLIKSYELQQITDLIQFDAYDYKENDKSSKTIAYLRASEVKPKLDKFIHKFLLKNIKNGVLEINAKDRNGDPITTNNLDEYLIDCGILLGEKSNFSSPDDGQTRSFNYAMRIETDGDVEINKWKSNSKKLEDESKLYFALTGVKPGDNHPQKVFRLKTSSLIINYKNTNIINVKLNKSIEGIAINKKMNCFSDIVEFCLPFFFAQTNFGARSSKGYGSFEFVCDNNFIDPMSYRKLMSMFTDNKIYCLEKKSSLSDKKKIMDTCYEISSTMRKFLLTSLDPEGKKSDKICIKELRNLIDSNNENIEVSDNYMFIRAILGLYNSLEVKDSNEHVVEFLYKSKPEEEGDKEKIERMESPVLLKPIDGKIFLISRNFYKKILGKQFIIKVKPNIETSNEVIIEVPSDFKMNKFLKKYKSRYENKNNNKSIEELK